MVQGTGNSEAGEESHLTQRGQVKPPERLMLKQSWETEAFSVKFIKR